MKKVTLFLLLFTTLLVGCQTQEPIDSPENVESHRTGTEGIRMNFLENLPPDTIFDEEGSERFVISLEVQNAGANTISNDDVRFWVSGFDRNIITNIQTRQGGVGSTPPFATVTSGTFEGKGFGIPEGEIDVIEFTGKVADLNAQNIERYETNLQVTACYNYKTIATAQICLDPDPFGPGQKICTPSYIPTGTQGAPIAVTGIDVEARSNSARVAIELHNSGSGDVFLSDLTKCSPYAAPGLSLNELDKVIPKVFLSGNDITSDCRPQDQNGQIRLVDGSARIICDIEIEGNTAFEAPLNVEVEYQYRQTTKKQLTILPDSR